MPPSPPTHQCPYCSGAMRPVAMECPACQIEVRGEFRQTRFARCSPEDLDFLEQYLLAGFSIKALAEETGLGYAAIRSRLDRLIESYAALHRADAQRQLVLERLESGKITPEEAAKALERL